MRKKKCPNKPSNFFFLDPLLRLCVSHKENEDTEVKYKEIIIPLLWDVIKH